MRALRFRSAICGLLRHAQTEMELAQGACEIAVSTVDYLMAWVGVAEDNPEKSLLPLCHAGKEDGYLSAVQLSWDDCEIGRGPGGTAVRERRPVFCGDVLTDPKMEVWRKEGTRRGYRSLIALPLIVDDAAIGVFVLYGRKPDIFSNEEVHLLTEAARDLAYGISSLRLREQRAIVERQLQLAKVEADSLNLLKSQFLDTAAHELRTPITAFSILIQSSRMQLERGKPVDLPALDRISGQVARLTGLVDGLINASQLEQKTLAIHPVDTDIVSLVSGRLNGFKCRFPQREFVFAPPDRAIMLKLDPIRIGQVVDSLIDNSVKYSPECQPVEVRIQSMPNGRTQVAIRDRGQGISQEQQSRVFSRFFRTPSSETLYQSGLGLGLFISRSIVELHGGSIGFQSEADEGSTFYFDLLGGE